MNNCPTPDCNAPWVGTGLTTRTLVGFSSPPGHDHDDNCVKREYICANGHKHILSIVRTCPHPDCDWSGITECFCHPYPKLTQWPTA